MFQRTSVGLDVHARSVVVCGLDGLTGEVVERRLTSQYGELLEARRRVKERLKVLAPHEYAKVSFSYVEVDTGRELFIETPMGSRGGTNPTHRYELRSMIAEHAIDVLRESPDVWDEFAAFEVEVLAPERTLLEKLAMLHDRATRSPDAKANGALLKGGRHLYDVHQLLNSDSVINQLSKLGIDGVAALCADIDEHSEGAGFGKTPRPDGGYGDSPLLDPSAPCRPDLARGYDIAMALVYLHKPSFDECIETIRARAEIL